MSELILGLNRALAKEYAAAIQYFQHAAVIAGNLSAFAGELTAHGGEEIDHAKKLNDHINFLGGIPAVTVAQIFTASDATAMLQMDLDGESDAIAIYKSLITLCRASEDYGTEAILLEILADEEHHANDLRTWLGR